MLAKNPWAKPEGAAELKGKGVGAIVRDKPEDAYDLSDKSVQNALEAANVLDHSAHTDCGSITDEG
eukprot:5145337-Alexandrium_andersonii.AAC.1